MGGIMWALRWLAAATIFTNCIVMTIDAQLQSKSIDLTQSKPLIAQDEVRCADLCMARNARVPGASHSSS